MSPSHQPSAFTTVTAPPVTALPPFPAPASTYGQTFKMLKIAYYK